MNQVFRSVGLKLNKDEDMIPGLIGCLVMVILMFWGVYSCEKVMRPIEGEYKYIIHMADGSKVKAQDYWPDDGSLFIRPPWPEKGYYISSTIYIRTENVGKRNIYTDEKDNR